MYSARDYLPLSPSSPGFPVLALLSVAQHTRNLEPPPILFSLQLEPKAASPLRPAPATKIHLLSHTARRGQSLKRQHTLDEYQRELYPPTRRCQETFRRQVWSHGTFERDHPLRKGKCRAFPFSVDLRMEESSVNYECSTCKISILLSPVSVVVFEDGLMTCSFLLASHLSVICRQFSTV